MATIETFRGSAEELADFVGLVWNHSYAGKMAFPRWTPEFFRWQFRWDMEGARENLLAAYEGTKLVGVLLGTDYMLESPAGIHPGSLWSWLSIHPDHRGQGIATELDQERVRRQQAQGAPLVFSFRQVGSRHSQAERPHTNSPQKRFHRKLGFWARVLAPDRFAQWHYSRFEGWLGRVLAPLARVRKAPGRDDSIREFSPADLDSCLSLLQESQSATALQIHWTPDTLRHHLSGSPISQTLVLEERGQITGLVNFHVLPFQARTVENVGVFDVIAFQGATLRGQYRLINAALRRMVQQEAVVTLKLRCGDTPAWPMLRTHFVPEFPETFLVLQSTGPPVDVPSRGGLHLLWR